MALIEGAHKAAQLLLDHAYVRIVARATPDAICGAALLAHALRRENVDFHFTALNRFTAEAADGLVAEDADALVLIGLSGDADAGVAERLPGRKVVIERRTATIPGEVIIDAPRVPGKEDEATLSGFAYYVALSISKRNRDLAILAVAGPLGEARNIEGFRGLTHDIIDQGVESGVLLTEPAIALHGSTLENALTHLDLPYVAGVTGRARNVKKLLTELKLNGSTSASSLSLQDKERLASFLTLRLLAQDAPDSALDALFRPQVRALAGPYTGLDAPGLARQAEAACTLGAAGLGFAAIWPDTAAGAELLPRHVELRETLLVSLLKAEREGTSEPPFFTVEAPDAGACTPLAARVAASLVAPDVIVLARHADETVATLALRTFGPRDLAAALPHIAAIEGAHVVGGKHWARILVPVPEEGRARKALSEALA